MEDDEATPEPIERTERERELQEVYERECKRDFVQTADINDVLDLMMKRLPQRTWLELNGHHDVQEVCPLLTVHFILGIPFETLREAFSDEWGCIHVAVT